VELHRTLNIPKKRILFVGLIGKLSPKRKAFIAYKGKRLKLKAAIKPIKAAFFKNKILLKSIRS